MAWPPGHVTPHCGATISAPHRKQETACLEQGVQPSSSAGRVRETSRFLPFSASCRSGPPLCQWCRGTHSTDILRSGTHHKATSTMIWQDRWRFCLLVVACGSAWGLRRSWSWPPSQRSPRSRTGLTSNCCGVLCLFRGPGPAKETHFESVETTPHLSGSSTGLSGGRVATYRNSVAGDEASPTGCLLGCLRSWQFCHGTSSPKQPGGCRGHPTRLDAWRRSYQAPPTMRRGGDVLFFLLPYGKPFQDIRDLQHLEFPFDQPKLLSSGIRRTLSFRSRRH